jgi:TPR repeat protein
LLKLDDALAQYLLGFCYESGNGLEKNQAEAIRLYHEAANKGIPQAQFSLGCCYIDGKGVSRDRVEGYAYLKLASNRLELAQKFLSDLENKLTPEEIAAGQRRTKELQKK